MTGFAIEKVETRLRLVFSDPSFEGLEVIVRLVPLDMLVDAARFASVKKVTPAVAAKIGELVEVFADALVSWNLTRDGKPISADLAGIKSLDLVFTLQLIESWVGAIGEIAAKEAEETAVAAAVAEEADELERSLGVSPLQ